MIQEDYCSFEVAKLLKEKGFDEQCRDFYRQENGNWLHRNTYEYNYFNLQMPIWKDCYACPTHQMAMKWLRKKYNIYISIQPDFPSDKDYKMCWCWSASILFENCISTTGYQCYIETYEDAVEASLKYCLENLI